MLTINQAVELPGKTIVGIHVRQDEGIAHLTLNDGTVGKGSSHWVQS